MRRSKRRLDLRDERVEGQRLLQVGGDRCRNRRRRAGDDDDRDASRAFIALQGGVKALTIQPRHVEIEHDEVRKVPGEEFQRVEPVAGETRIELGAVKRHAQHLAGLQIVVNDEDGLATGL